MTSIALLPPTDATLRGTSRAASWAFQILAAVILAITLPYKFSGAEETVRLFDALGAGAVGMYGTAILETVAVALLLTPRLAVLGGALTVGLLSGAVFSHLTVLGILWDGDASLFTMAVVGLASGLIVTWLRRRQLPVVGRRFA